jgi:hypothetical protein
MFTQPGLVSQLARRLPPKADWRWSCTCLPAGTDPRPVYGWSRTSLSGPQANDHTQTADLSPHDARPPNGRGRE